MEQEMTIKELIALVNDCPGDFLIQMDLREEDACEEENTDTVRG